MTENFNNKKYLKKKINKQPRPERVKKRPCPVAAQKGRNGAWRRARSRPFGHYRPTFPARSTWAHRPRRARPPRPGRRFFRISLPDVKYCATPARPGRYWLLNSTLSGLISPTPTSLSPAETRAGPWPVSRWSSARLWRGGSGALLRPEVTLDEAVWLLMFVSELAPILRRVATVEFDVWSLMSVIGMKSMRSEIVWLSFESGADSSVLPLLSLLGFGIWSGEILIIFDD